MNFKAGSLKLLVAGWLVTLPACTGKSSNDGQTSSEASSTEIQMPPGELTQNESSQSASQKERSQEDAGELVTIEQAEALARSGDLETAAAATLEVLIREPKNARAIFLMANLEASRGNLDQAVKVIGEISADSPDAYMPSLGQAADWLMMLQRYDEAEANYREILKLVPTADVARRPLADLLNRRGLRQDAAEEIQLLCRAGNVTEDELQSLMSVPDAFFDETQMNAESPKSPIGATALARIAFTKGEIQAAQEALRPEFETNSLRPAEQAFYGRLLAENQSFDEMSAWLGRSRESTSGYGDHWFAIGSWMLWEERIDDAVAAFAKAVQLVPTDRVAMTRMGDALRRRDDDESAKWAADRAEKISKSLRLSERIGLSQTPDPTTVNELAELLSELDRPFEAIMWRGVALGYSKAPVDQMTVLNAKRLELLKVALAKPTEHLPPAMRSDWQAGDDAPLIFVSSLPRSQTASLDIQASVPRRGVARFEDIAESVGVRGRYFNAVEQDERMRLLHEQIGGGVAVFDYDLDGRPDLYFTQGGSVPDLADLDHWQGAKPNQFYRHEGDQYRDVTISADADDRGYGQGVTAGDFNADGFPDLLIANIGHNRLLINNGDGRFRDASAMLWQGSGRWTTCVAIADVDGDRLPDIVETNYVGEAGVFDASKLKVDEASGMVFSVRPGDYKGQSDRVFINDGLGGSRPIELKSGDDANPSDALALLVTDIDGLGRNEMFVANDMRANQYWVAADDSGNRWVDRAVSAGCAYSDRGDANACMGIASADFDADGDLDFAVTNFYLEPMNFYVQKSPGQFQDLAAKSNLFSIGYNVNGFGTQPIDYDNNGRVDLVVMNGHIHDNRAIGLPFKMLPQLIDGSAKQFDVLDVEDNSSYWSTPTLGRAVATLDWNADGRVDLVTTHLDHPHALLQNNSDTTGNFIDLKLIGTASERDAIGARVHLVAGGRKFYDVIKTGDGFASKNEPGLHFGIGLASVIDQLKITWPSGGSQVFNDLDANRRYLIVEGNKDAFVEF